MKNLIISLVIIALMFYLFFVLRKNNSVDTNINNSKQSTTMSTTETKKEASLPYVEKYSEAVLKTSKGNIKIKFYVKDAPKTVNNFMKLADEKFYDGTAFHRVIKDFMIQGGDPLSKAEDWKNVAVGTGDPGYKFADEFNSRKLVKGSIAMANSGPNTNGSQFFIVTAENTPWLDGKHTNFGEITDGMDVVEKVEKSETNAMDQPLEKIRINSIQLIEK